MLRLSRDGERPPHPRLPRLAAAMARNDRTMSSLSLDGEPFAFTHGADDRRGVAVGAQALDEGRGEGRLDGHEQPARGLRVEEQPSQVVRDALGDADAGLEVLAVAP